MLPQGFYGGSRRRSSSKLAVRCDAFALSLCPFVLSILPSGGAGEMTNAGAVIDAVDYSLTASLFIIDSSYSS